VLRLLQARLCRQYAGLRPLCRLLLCATFAVAVLPGAWTLAFRPGLGPPLVALNHAFALGVFAQTSVRSLVLVHWLHRPGFQGARSMAALSETIRRAARYGE